MQFHAPTEPPALAPTSQYVEKPEEKDRETSLIEADTDHDAIAARAEQFADAMFPNSHSAKSGTTSSAETITISMAAIQGYLLEHSDNPKVAVSSVARWMESQRAGSEAPLIV